MPFYQKQGSVPNKRHITHYHNGKLCYEEHISREGFSDIYANVYHLYPPTKVKKVGPFKEEKLIPLSDQTHRHRHLETFRDKTPGDFAFGRHYLAFNDDVRLAVCIAQTADFFYRNGQADELLFVHRGTGVLESNFGNLSFKPGDYIVIPRGVIYRMRFESDDNKLFIIESPGVINTPKRYKNKHGQHLEHAPFSERDFRVPEFVGPTDEKGTFPVHVRMKHGVQTYDLAHHPFDIVGWDGYYFPWIFNINDFMPIVGKVHQPPPVHQTFESAGFVVCSFVPRLYDFHEQSIPAPYAHSNVESDEVLYYVKGNFMSRKGISEGSLTLHPMGLPHGPQPGRYEESIGKKETNELAVMVDTFRPLILTEFTAALDDPDYPLSWME